MNRTYEGSRIVLLARAIERAEKHIDTMREAVTKLGPERAQKALASFAPGAQPSSGFSGGWKTCALARAYGEPTEFAKAAKKWAAESGLSTPAVVEARFGEYGLFATAVFALSPDEVAAIVECFDNGANLNADDNTVLIDGRAALRGALEDEAAKYQKPVTAVVPEIAITLVIRDAETGQIVPQLVPVSVAEQASANPAQF